VVYASVSMIENLRLILGFFVVAVESSKW